MPLLPVETIHLFAGERDHLLELLRSLTPDDWSRPTACDGWDVHVVALHLLGDDIGKLSGGRDGHRNPEFSAGIDLGTFAGLVRAIDRSNDTWVRAARRISPQLTIDLLALTGDRLDHYVTTLDLEEVGQSVDWASAGPAPVWFDLAREYTERWHHQQHIRDAVGKPGLMDRYWLRPVLETFLRGLYRSLDHIERPAGTTLALTISGDAGGTWYAVRVHDGWDLRETTEQPATTTVTLPQDLAWRLFTKGVSPEQAKALSTSSGDADLVDAVFGTVSILAE